MILAIVVLVVLVAMDAYAARLARRLEPPTRGHGNRDRPDRGRDAAPTSDAP